MAWTGLNLTVDGRTALNKAQTDKHLNFRSIVVGDGAPPNNFSTIKKLVHQLYELTELKIDVTDTGCLLTVDLPDVDYDYYMREIGVIVTTDDGDKLYVYDNCGDDAQYIVVTTGAEKTKKRIRLELIVSDVENITVAQPSVMYVAYDDYENTVARLEQEKVDVSGGDISDTIALFDEKKEDKNDVNIASGDKLRIILEKIYRAIKAFFVHKSDTVIHTTQADKDKLAGIEEKANRYVHPDTHPAGMITPDEKHRFVSDSEKATWNGTLDASRTYTDGMYRQATGYTDKKISDLIGGAPESLDTLKEVADAIKENETVMDALDAAIGKKAGQAELDTHTGNGTIHITASERTKWNNAVSKTGDTSDTTVTFTQASARVKPSTGEKLSAVIGKIVKWLADLKTVAFSGSYKDLSDTPSSLPADGGNASTVNGHTVNSNVPANAKFTDTNTWRPLGTTADTACAGNDSRLSNARPASDVYSWAKAASKPSYSWSEIGSKPSTFTPSAHNHTKSQISDFPSSLPANGGTATYANYVNVVATNEIRLNNRPSKTINLYINYAWADGVKSALINDYNFFNGNGENYADIKAKRLIGDLSAARFDAPLTHSRQCSWINARAYSAIKSPAASGDSFLPVMSVGATSGVWTIGNLSGEKTLTFVFTLDSDYNSGNNKTATRVTLPPTASGDFITSSGGTMTGPLSMNGKILYLYSTTCRIEANAQDVNIISAGSGTNASGYINLRPNAAVQVRDTSNSSWKPISALAFNTQSSRRYKKNIVDMSEEEAKRVLRYRVVKYDCINENDGTGCEGLIAEEVAEVDEYPVYRTPDGTIEGLDYSKFVPQLIKMVQLQQKEIDELRKELGR